MLVQASSSLSMGRTRASTRSSLITEIYIRHFSREFFLLTINGETLQATNLHDACRYPGYWGTGTGDMRATQEVVIQKIIAARDLIKCLFSHQS